MLSKSGFLTNQLGEACSAGQLALLAASQNPNIIFHMKIPYPFVIMSPGGFHMLHKLG